MVKPLWRLNSARRTTTSYLARSARARRPSIDDYRRVGVPQQPTLRAAAQCASLDDELPPAPPASTRFFRVAAATKVDDKLTLLYQWVQQLLKIASAPEVAAPGRNLLQRTVELAMAHVVVP